MDLENKGSTNKFMTRLNIVSLVLNYNQKQHHRLDLAQTQ